MHVLLINRASGLVICHFYRGYQSCSAIRIEFRSFKLETIILSYFEDLIYVIFVLDYWEFLRDWSFEHWIYQSINYWPLFLSDYWHGYGADPNYHLSQSNGTIEIYGLNEGFKQFRQVLRQSCHVVHETKSNYFLI